MKPLNDYIIIKALPKETVTKTGIILPDNIEEDVMIETGEVIYSADSKVKKGDKIIFSRFLPMNFNYNEQEVWALQSKDVIAIL
jgi:chaperonin GroES